MSARFTVQLTPSFQHDLEGLPISARKKVLKEINRLGTNPFAPPTKIKKLKGKGVGQWRREVWPYRVRYDVVGRDVVLYRVRHRKEIYHG